MNQKKKEVKVGMSTLNWILSIGGILFFALLIILPPIFRTVFEDYGYYEEAPTPTVSPTITPSVSPTSSPLASATPIPTEDTNTSLSCKKESERETKVYEIYHLEDTIQIVAETTTQISSSTVEEDNEMCSTLLSTYQNIPGYYYSCVATEGEVQISSRVNFQEYTGGEITIPIVPGETFTEFQNFLQSDGYVCE